VPCTFPNHDECPENNVDGPRRTFALLRNDGSGTMSDVWSDSDDQNIHKKTYDFAFIDLNQDGCLDLFMGLCRGYQVMIQECPPTGSGS